jgi:hypothetical protein
MNMRGFILKFTAATKAREKMEHNEYGRIVTLKKFNDTFSADEAKLRLEENGIESFVEDLNVVGMDPMAGVALKVFEKDEARALEIIAG